MSYVFAPPATVGVPVWASEQLFPVHRIYCVGRNYEEHAKEMGGAGREPPFFFQKPTDAIAGGLVHMPYPTLTQNLHHEVELVVAIGTGGSHITSEQAHRHIFGYAVGLDMTRRDLQNEMKKQGRPWSIGKGSDYSAPIGVITPTADVANIHQAAIALTVNSQARQTDNISQLIWSISATIEQLSAAWALQPGDLIFTGTPAGVGPVVRGDVLEGQVDGLQNLRVQII